MELWLGKVTTATLFVDDLEAAKHFYADVFGVPMIFTDDNSAVFDLGTLIINLLREEAAHELIAPARVASSAAGSRLQFTIEVDDVDARCAELTQRGVSLLNGPMDRPWGLRTACFADPAGHVWEVAHPLERPVLAEQ